MNNDNLKGLYETLKREGYEPPVYEQFEKDMQDEKNLQGAYQTLKNEGYEPPAYETFRSDMGFGGDGSNGSNGDNGVNGKDGSTVTQQHTQPVMGQKPQNGVATQIPEQGSPTRGLSQHTMQQPQYSQEVYDRYDNQEVTRKGVNDIELKSLEDIAAEMEAEKAGSSKAGNGLISRALGAFGQHDAQNAGMGLGVEAAAEPLPAVKQQDTQQSLEDPLEKRYAQIVQEGNVQESPFQQMVVELLGSGKATTPVEAQQMAYDLNYRYADKTGASTVGKLLDTIGQPTPEMGTQIDNGWYNEGVQSEIEANAKRLGLNYDDYVRNHVKPAMQRELEQRYGYSEHDAKVLSGRMFENPEHVRKQMEYNAAGNIIGNFMDGAVRKEFSDLDRQASPLRDALDMSGESFLYAKREYNKQTDPDKILSSLLDKQHSLYIDLLTDSRSLNQIQARADALGIGLGDYLDQYVAPQLNNAIVEKFRQVGIERELPKDTMDYVLGGFEDSVGGMLLSRMMNGATRQEFKNEALAMTEAGENPYMDGKPGLLAQGGRLATGMAADFWLWGGWGKIGSKATQQLMKERIAHLAAERGVTEAVAYRLAEEEAGHYLKKGVVNNLFKHVPQSAITMSGAEATTAAVQGIRDRQDMGTIINNTVGQGVHGAFTGTAFGLTGGLMGGLTQGLTGAKRLVGKLAGLEVEAATLYTTEELARMANGEEAFDNPFEGLVESNVKLGFIKASANPVRAIGRLFDAVRHPVKALRAATESQHTLTDEDVADIMSSNDGRTLMDALTAMRPADNAREPGNRLGEVSEEDAEKSAAAYRDFMTDPDRPWIRKQKVARLLGGMLPPPGLEVSAEQVNNGDGTWSVRTRDYDGQTIRLDKYDSLYDADVAIDDMERDLDTNRTEALRQRIDMYDAYRNYTNYLEAEYETAVQKMRSGAELTDGEKQVVYLHQHRGEMLDIQNKLNDGEELSEEENRLGHIYTERFNDYVRRGSASDAFTREWEKANGLPEGTVEQAIYSPERDETQQRIADAYREAMEERIEELKTTRQERDGGSDVAMKSLPEMTGPAATEPQPAEKGGDVADVVSPSYERGRTAIVNNDGGEMRQIGHEVNVADARIARMFSKEEAAAIYQAVESGDEVALAAVIQQQTEPAKRDAIMKLAEALDAARGMDAAFDEQTAGIEGEVRAEAERYQSEDGRIVPLTLSDGSTAFLMNGDPENEYGTVNVAYTDEAGQVQHKQIAARDITSIGEAEPTDAYVARRTEELIKEQEGNFKNQIGGVDLRTGNTVELTMAGQTAPFRIDGFFENGDLQLSDEGGEAMRMSRDEVIGMIRATEEKRVGEELDAEEKALKEAEKARKEAEKAEAERLKGVERDRRAQIEEIRNKVLKDFKDGKDSKDFKDGDMGVMGVMGDMEEMEKYLLEHFDSEVDADAFIREQRVALRNYQRDEVQPKIDALQRDLDAYARSEREMTPEEMAAVIQQHTQLMRQQEFLNGQAQKLKDASKRVGKTYSGKVGAQGVDAGDARSRRLLTLQKARSYEDKLKKARELYAGDAEASSLFDFESMEPKTIEEYAAEFLGAVPEQGKGIIDFESLQEETGHGGRRIGGDSRGYSAYLAPKGKGESIKALAHKMWERLPEQLHENWTDQDCRNALIEVLSSAQVPTDIRDYILNDRINQAEKYLRAQEEYEEELRMQDWAEAYHIPAGEREAYEESIHQIGEEYSSLTDDDIQKINAIFAEEKVLRDEQDRRSQEMDRQPVAAGDGGEGTGGQGEIRPLSSETADTQDQGRPDGDGQDVGKDEDAAAASVVPDSDVAGGAQGGVSPSPSLPRREGDFGPVYEQLTAFEKKNSALDNTTDTGETAKRGRQDDTATLQNTVSVSKDTENISNLQENEGKVAAKQQPAEKSASIQGIEGYDADEVLNAVRGDIEMKLEDAGIEGVTIKGMALHGSRMRGDAREDSDLDVVVEYEGDFSEDGLFNILNEVPTTIEGITVDINPITKGKSGTLEEYMERSRKYDEEKTPSRPPRGEEDKGLKGFKERLATAVKETNTEPTEGQKEAGNYKKGHLSFGGYNFTVENPKGSVRSGKDASGKPWSITMHNTYGYLTGKGHLGKDGDHLDVFINDDADLDLFGNNGINGSDGKIYIIDQVNADGSFDEHKIMWGFNSEVDAIRNYLMNYSRPWHGLGNITGVDKATFDKWVESSDRKMKPFAETRFGDKRDVAAKVMEGIARKKEADGLNGSDENNGKHVPVLDKGDYKTYMTPEAREHFANHPRFANLAHRELAFITAAVWDGVVIPVEELAKIPEIVEAEQRVKAKEQMKPFTITDEQAENYAKQLLDIGSAVYENGKMKMVDGKEDFSGPVRQERKAFVIIGRPAGGKSSVFANPLSHQHGARIIDSDVVKEWFDEFDDGYGAGYVQGMSGKVAERAMEIAVQNGDNIVIPRIGGASVIREAVALRAIGYDVQLYYNDVVPETSYMRSNSRFAMTGRFLSLDYLTNIKDKPSKNFSKFAEKSIGEYLDECTEEEVQKLRGRIGRLAGSQQSDLLRALYGRLDAARRGNTHGGVSGYVERSEPDGTSSRIGRESPIFTYAEWKSNDVPKGEKPKEIWNSESGDPLPGSVKKENPVKEHTDGQTAETANRRDEGVVSVGTDALGSDEAGTDGGVRPAGTEAVASGRPSERKPSGNGRKSVRNGRTSQEGGQQLSLFGDRGDGSGDVAGAVRPESGARGGKLGGSAASGGSADRRGSVSQQAEAALKPQPTEKDRRADDGSVKTATEKARPLNTRNYLYPKDASDIDNMSPRERLEANVRALEILRTLLLENRSGTPEEIAEMGRFRGWGGIKDVESFYRVESLRYMDRGGSGVYSRLADVIKGLDPDGKRGLLDTIRRSALTSYYTPTDIARAINHFLEKAGFKGGDFLDGSYGVGVLEGTMPKAMQQRTQIHGVELDWLTGQLAKHLYPDADIRIQGFQDVDIADNSMDVVGSNIPFGDIEVFDKKWKNNSDPTHKIAQKRIHNYYVVSKIDKTKPGGLLYIMTSNAVMDTPGNKLIREYIADQCEILGAVRLPDNTFKGAGTKVVTDVIFLRKFKDAEDRVRTLNGDNGVNGNYESDILKPFLGTADKKVVVKGAFRTDEVTVRYNGYYGSHPEMMLGDVKAGGQYRGDEFGLTSDEGTSELAKKMTKLIDKHVIGDRAGKLIDTHRTERKVMEAVRESYVGDGNYVSNGNLIEQNGKFGVLETQRGEGGETIRQFVETPGLKKDAAKIKTMIPLRSTLKKLISEEIGGASDSALSALRSELKKAYDAYVKKYGRLQDKGSKYLDNDIDGFTLRSLEKWKDGKFVGLSDIFEKSTIKPKLKLGDASKKNPTELVTLSLAEFGEIRGSFMEEHLGPNWQERMEGLVFEVPFSDDHFVTRDLYLSGDVKSKLTDAERAASTDSKWQKNVEALKEVQPKDIPFVGIGIHMGARWIPDKVYTEFIWDLLGVDGVYGPNGANRNTGIHYVAEADTFMVSVSPYETSGKAKEWRTNHRKAEDLIECALKNDKTRVQYTVDGESFFDVQETEQANDKIQEIREKFEDWLPQNRERVEELTRLYNDKFNRTVIPHFDGSHLQVPGLQGIELRPHQKDAVWMLINNRGGIIDHIVGAGKTLVMQCAIMEMRRMGIAKKPMIIALKSTVPQIKKEFLEAFPAARILAPSEKDFTAKNRKKILSQIALNDWDCVILSHENYGMLPHTEEIETGVIREQLDQLEASIQLLQEERQSDMTKRQKKALEKRKQRLENKMEKLLDRKVDREFTFENLGVDYLFVDECQQFKSLPYTTTHQNVAGLSSPEGSSRATALLCGARYLQELHQGDMGLTLLSGTTISNSLVELYNLLQYVRPNKMAELGFSTFDAWASNFAVNSAELEYNHLNELTTRSRFRNFDNLPELSKLYTEVADVRNDNNLELPKPKKRVHVVTVPATDALREITDACIDMCKRKDGSYFGIPNKTASGKDQPWSLLATNLSTQAAINVKLIDPEMDDGDGGKVKMVCDKVKELYDKFDEWKGTQMIFCDLGVPGPDKAYDVYNDIINRLVNNYGIPREEIVDIHTANTDVKKNELFRKMNNGDVRVLIAGAKNGGTGVNVQQRMVAIHHVDMSWNPANITQEDGRGARQGNWLAKEQNDNHVDIFFYATENSLDLYKYQLVDAKQKMIDRFKTSTTGDERDFSEAAGDDSDFDASAVVAMLSGNPVILDKAKQDKKVEKLLRAKRQYDIEYEQRQHDYESDKRTLSNFERLVDLNAKDRNILTENGFVPDKKGVYPATVKVVVVSQQHAEPVTKTFDKPGEAGQFIHEQMKGNAKVRLEAFGMTANIVVEMGGDLFTTDVVLDAPSGIRYVVELSDNDVAAGTSMRRLLQKVIENGEKYKEGVEQYQRKVSDGDPGEKSWPRQAELDEAIARKKELDEEYKKLQPKDEKPDEDSAEAASSEPLPAENTEFSIRQEAAPRKTGIGYKVFVLKDGKLYPPMVANPGGEDTPVGVWLNADAAPVSGTSKTGRPQVKAGGKGTQGGSGQLAYRPGWHLGVIPYALQFSRKDPVTGERTLFPNNFVWAEVEYANDVDYQEEARQEGINANGKYQHSLAGLKHLPVDGSYMYRTNPDPNTDPWIITGAMRVKRVLKPSEVDDLVKAAGREPQKRQEGFVTDVQVENLNKAITLQRDKEREAHELATKAVMQVLGKSGVGYHEVSQEEAQAVLRKAQGQKDRKYMDAVERGDMKSAQKMVEEAAKKGLPDTKVVDEDGNPLVLYHGTNLTRKNGSKPFWVFKTGSHFGTAGQAKVRQEGEALFDLKMNQKYGKPVQRELTKTYAVYLDIKNPKRVSDVPADEDEWDGTQQEWWNKQIARAQAQGYDGLVYQNEYEDTDYPADSWIAFSPEQIKSADAVTYDDKGNIIPLSNRFDKSKDDLRFQVKEPLVTSEGVVYGYTDGEDIYLTPDGINPETPAHEYGHLWVKAVKKNRPDLWENIKDLMRVDEHSQKVYQKLLGDENYSQIHDNEDKLYEEVLTQMGGKKNRQRFEQAAREVIDEAPTAAEAVKVANVISRIRRAFRKLWDWVGKSLFQIKKFRSVDEVTDRMMYDFVEGNLAAAKPLPAEKEAAQPEFQVGKGKPRKMKGEGMAHYFERLREWDQREKAKKDAAEDGIMEPSREQADAKAHADWARDHAEWERNPDGKAEPMEWDYSQKAEKEYREALQAYEEKIDGYMPERTPELTKEDVIVEREMQVKTPAQKLMNDISEHLAREYDPYTARDAVKDAVIQRRKDIEEVSADDSIYIEGIRRETNRLADELMAKMGVEGARLKTVKLLQTMSDGKVKPQVTGGDIRRAIPYLIEAPMRRRDMANEANEALERLGYPARFTGDDIKRAEKELDAIRDEAQELLALHKEMAEDGRTEMTVEEQGLYGRVREGARKVADAMNGGVAIQSQHTGKGPRIGADDIMATLSILTKRVKPEGLKVSEDMPELQPIIGRAKDWYAVAYGWLEDAGMRPDDIGYYKDYVNHVWDKERSDPEAYERYVANRQPTKSRNMRKREIRTLMEGEELGLVPKYDDIADLMGEYSKTNIQSWANKKMLVDLSGIDVVERDDSGEPTSMMSLLTSRTPGAFDMDKYDYFEIAGVGPVWVHKAAAKNFGLVFETYEPGKLMGTYDKAASIAKNIELAWSGFHAAALTEVYVAQNVTRPKRATENFYKYLIHDSLLQGQPPAYADPELYKDAARHLVKLGATGDYAPEAMKQVSEQLKDFFSELRMDMEENGGLGKAVGMAVGIPEVVATAVKLVNEGMDKALWTWLHDGLKLCQYKMFREDVMAKAGKEGWSQDRINKALDEAGQYINDEFGGQHFEVIGVSPKTLRMMRRFLLSPDWLLSTQRHFLATFGFGSIYNKANVRNFRDFYRNVWHRGKGNEGQYDGRYSRAKASLACYVLGCMIMYPLVMNALNALLRKKDEEYEAQMEQENPGYVSKYKLAYPEGMKGFERDNLSLNPFNSFNIFGDYGMGSNAEGKKSHLFAGRYGDDTEMYIRWGKQFREFPELFETEQGELGFPGPLLKRLMGKSNPNIRFLYDTLNYYTRWDKSKSDEDLEAKWKAWIGDGKLQHNIGIPVGVGANKLWQNYLPFWVPTQSDKEWKPTDMILPSTKGFTPYKARNYFMEFIKAGDEDGIKETFKASVLNGMTSAQISRAFDAARKAVENESRELQLKDGNDIHSVTEAFDASQDLKERKELNSRIRKMLAADAEPPQDWNEFMTTVRAERDGTTEGVTKASERYLMVATSADVLEDARLAQLKKKASEMKRIHDGMKDNKADGKLLRQWEQQNQKWLDAGKMIKDGESGSESKQGILFWKKKMTGKEANDRKALEMIRKKRKNLLKAVGERVK